MTVNDHVLDSNPILGRLAVLCFLIAASCAAFAQADDTSTCGGDCKQVMLSMAYAANLSGSIDLDDPTVDRLERLTAVTADRIDCALSSATALGGAWERTWGPALVLEPNTVVLQTTGDPVTLIDTWDPAPVANTMFVAKKKDAEVYVVAIAGTDSASQFDWAQEDFDAYPVLWPYGGVHLTVLVTRGTLTGLNLLQTMTSKVVPHRAGDTELSLEQYLGRVVANTEATLFFTGHSLGGALAPATALWLHDQRKHWDLDDHATLKIYAFAGATPGNGPFATYVGNRFEGENMVIVNNSLDVVPHAFRLATLKQLDTLYEAEPKTCEKKPTSQNCIEPSMCESGAIAQIIEKVQKAEKNFIYYETLGERSQVQGFSGDLVSRSGLTQVKDCDLYQSAAAKCDVYAKEALYQHVCAYPVKLGVPQLNPQMSQCRQQHPGR